MAEKVEIIVTAKDAASQVLRGVTSNFGEIGNAIQALTSGTGLEYLTSQVIQFGKESVEATVAYANEVRNLSQITGASAEETSRLIQVADDYKISTEQLTAAQRALAKDSITLTTSSLADLSDEYNKLAPGQERVTFLMDKFGRSGLKMAELLEQGGDSIRKMSDAVDDSLVLTDQAVKNAREYEMAMDSLEEQTKKLQYALGSKLLPALTGVVEEFNRRADSGTIFDPQRMIPIYGGFLQLRDIYESFTNVVETANPTLDSATRSYMAMGETLQTTVNPALEQTEIDTKAISEANSLLLSTIQSVASQEQSYTSEINGLQAQRLELQQKINDTPAWDTAKIADYKTQIEGVTAKEQEATKAFQQSAAERIFKITEQKLAMGGLTDAEADYLIKVSEGLGLTTKEQANAARAQLSEAQKLADGFADYQKQMKEKELGHFATSQEAWREYSANVSTQVDGNIQAVRDYISALGDIPTEINTAVNVTMGGGNDLRDTNSVTPTGTNVNYYIQNAYIGSDHNIQVV